MLLPALRAPVLSGSTHIVRPAQKRRQLLTTMAGDAVDDFYLFFYWTMAAGPTRLGACAGGARLRDNMSTSQPDNVEHCKRGRWSFTRLRLKCST